jgi:vacuolar-type H+-ATPase subunit B/Vma2
MKIDDIHTKIMTMDSKTINELVETIQQRRKQLHAEAGSKFRVGVVVQFGRPNGTKRRGTVEKLNTTKAVVNVFGQKWRVPFGMMELVK